MAVVVRLLGGFNVEVDGLPVPASSWASRRSRQLVAFLTLAPRRRATVEQVMDALWPDLDPEAARANLHKAASLARRALGSKDAVVFRGGSVALWPAAAVLSDVETFEALAQAVLDGGASAAPGEVAAAYGGELLPEESYEEWTLAPRERARRLYLDVLRADRRWDVLVELEPTDGPVAALAAVDEAALAIRGPLETCPPCSVNLTIPATIACAAVGDLDRANRHLAMAEGVVGVFYPKGGWRAALDEARAAVARSSGDMVGAARLLQQAREGSDRWGQRLDADRCRRVADALPVAGKV